MGRAWRVSREAEIGFLAFQVELLELSMTGPTGQIGKNNMRELALLSIRLGEPGGCLLLPAGLGMALRCSGMGEVGLAAPWFVQDIPPGDAAPVPHPAEHALAAAPPFVDARVGSAGKATWERAGLHPYLLCTPSCHLRKVLELCCHPLPTIQGSRALWGCRSGQH